jgi:hypothetical protein
MNQEDRSDLALGHSNLQANPQSVMDFSEMNVTLAISLIVVCERRKGN